MSSSPDLHQPAGSTATQAYEVLVTPESAGWTYCSLRVLNLVAGQQHTLDTGADEVLVIPLSGAATVRLGEETLTLDGRVSVFDGPSDFAYVPVASTVEIGSDLGGRFALAGARTDQTLPFRRGGVDGIPVELRGAGHCSRQVRNFGMVDVFETGAIIACEVITPAGNWSSYPAHKHDEQTDTESELEEIYYFEIAAGPEGQPGVGYHRTSASTAGPMDVLAEVRDRDTVLVPHGWHGPCMAAPGFDMYYLNVMAGPGEQRAWLISDHPDHAWVRSTWTDHDIDPRVRGYGAR